jgi:hypothetical protein
MIEDFSPLENSIIFWLHDLFLCSVAQNAETFILVKTITYGLSQHSERILGLEIQLGNEFLLDNALEISSRTDSKLEFLGCA